MDWCPLTAFFFFVFHLIHVAGVEDGSSPNLLRLSKEKKKSPGKEELRRRCQKQDVRCMDLPAECLSCSFNTSCVYGQETESKCTPVSGISCSGDQSFEMKHVCMYCYQLPHQSYTCQQNDTCRIGTRFKSKCFTKDKILCLGNREFAKLVDCNYSSGLKWSTALLLSITMGGFGVDRFYLGNWQEGVGKLFSFGGLGVWTLLDVILIATGYLKPGESHYS